MMGKNEFNSRRNDWRYFKLFFSGMTFFLFFFFFCLATWCMRYWPWLAWSSPKCNFSCTTVKLRENEDTVKHLGMIYLTSDYSVPMYPMRERGREGERERERERERDWLSALCTLTLVVGKKFMSFYGKYICNRYSSSNDFCRFR